MFVTFKWEKIRQPNNQQFLNNRINLSYKTSTTEKEIMIVTRLCKTFSIRNYALDKFPFNLYRWDSVVALDCPSASSLTVVVVKGRRLKFRNFLSLHLTWKSVCCFLFSFSQVDMAISLLFYIAMNGQNGSQRASIWNHPLPSHQSDPVELTFVVKERGEDLMGLSFGIFSREKE